MNTKITEAELKAIRERCDLATSGPWKQDDKDWAMIHPPYDICGEDHAPITGFDSVDRKPDATFIAHSRTDIPALLDEVERLRAALRFYADESSFTIPAGSGSVVDYIDAKCPLQIDGGKKAREALGEK